jgi:hypothetical protein
MISSFLLFFFLVPLATFSILKKVNSLYALLFVLYFQAVFSLLNIPMPLVKATIEGLTWFFFLIAVFERNTVSRSLPGLMLMVAFSIFYLIVTILTKSLNFDAFSFYRHYLNSFLIMAAVYMYPFPKAQLFKINRFVFGLFLIQILASVIKLFVLGQYEEYAGTMNITNGSLNTIFPLFAMIFFVFAWLYMGREQRYLFYSLGFLLMGWVGGKRGIYFYLFVVLLMILWKRFRDLRRGSFLPMSVIRLLPVGIIFLGVVFYLGVRLTPTLNPEKKMWGRYDADFLATYLYTYNLMDLETGDYRGRYGGTYILLLDAFSGGGLALRNPTLRSNMVGFGPDLIVGDVGLRYEKQRISGVIRIQGTIQTGFTNIFIAMGTLGVLFTLWFYLFYNQKVSKISKIKELNPYWKTIASATFMLGPLFLIDFFTYSATMNTTNTLYVTWFFFTGQLLKSDFLSKYNSGDYPEKLI